MKVVMPQGYPLLNLLILYGMLEMQNKKFNIYAL
jgi:hypothetical protein